jgi:uncharacterized protein CbrC (UPF0167 family)
VNSIAVEVHAFKSEVSKQEFDDAKDHLQNLTGSLETFDETLDKREEVIMGVS